ncbi:uncharacterized protein PG998_007373 [Apiospora kogelbergensis]|uniref:Uncharacterized protein n=1 Tax=Apiospora kogelbergensis TaxID=1337665 RepID=A0AAW0QKX2_9PEZI
MARNRKDRGRGEQHRPHRASNDNDSRDVRGKRNSRTNHDYEARGRGNGRRPRRDRRQPKRFSPAFEEQHSYDEEIVLGPEFSPLYPGVEDDPVDDLPPAPPSVQTQFEPSRRQHQNIRGNNRNNPFIQLPRQQQQLTTGHSTAQRHQHQQYQRHLQRINRQRCCDDCRTVRKANVRFRNVIQNHLNAAAATVLEWSEEVGVPFGGVADDEMDWQPESEIKVVLVQQQQRQHEERRNNGSYYNNCNHHHNTAGGGLSLPNMFPVVSKARNGSGLPWWRELYIEPLEEEEGEEELFEVSPEEPMALGPDPFKASSLPGVGFTNYGGVPTIGTVPTPLFSYPGYRPIGIGR